MGVGNDYICSECGTFAGNIKHCEACGTRLCYACVQEHYVRKPDSECDYEAEDCGGDSPCGVDCGCYQDRFMMPVKLCTSCFNDAIKLCDGCNTEECENRQVCKCLKIVCEKCRPEGANTLCWVCVSAQPSFQKWLIQQTSCSSLGQLIQTFVNEDNDSN